MVNEGFLKPRLISMVITVVLSLSVVGHALAVEGGEPSGVTPTPFSMDLYGFIDGAGKGDVLRAYDSDGVLCAEFTIDKAGQYGFMHVYGDDPSTAADEGAQQGEMLVLELNGEKLISLSGEDLIWIGDRERTRVDFGLR